MNISTLLAPLFDDKQNVIKKPVSILSLSFSTTSAPILRTLSLIKLLPVRYDQDNCEFLIWRHFLKWIKFGGASKIG